MSEKVLRKLWAASKHIAKAKTAIVKARGVFTVLYKMGTTVIKKGATAAMTNLSVLQKVRSLALLTVDLAAWFASGSALFAVQAVMFLAKIPRLVSDSKAVAKQCF